MASFAGRMCAPAATRVEGSKNTRVATPSALETAATAAAAATATARRERAEPRFYDTPANRGFRGASRFERTPRDTRAERNVRIDSSAANPRDERNVRSIEMNRRSPSRHVEQALNSGKCFTGLSTADIWKETP